MADMADMADTADTADTKHAQQRAPDTEADTDTETSASDAALLVSPPESRS